MAAVVARTVKKEGRHAASLTHLRRKIGLVGANPPGGQNIRKLVTSARPDRHPIGRAIHTIADHGVSACQLRQRQVRAPLGPFQLRKGSGGIDDKLEFVRNQPGQPVIQDPGLFLFDPPGKGLVRGGKATGQEIRRHLAVGPIWWRGHIVNDGDRQR